jgi:hypothetical protein
MLFLLMALGFLIRTRLLMQVATKEHLEEENAELQKKLAQYENLRPSEVPEKEKVY